MNLVDGMQGMLQMTSKEYINPWEAHNEAEATNHKIT